MTNLNRFLLLLLTCCLAIFSLQTTFGFFSSSANSTSNSFIAAAAFPSPSVSSSPLPSPSPSASPTNLANHLVISEVQTRVASGGPADSDFIELYNPTSSSINLNGYRLVKRDSNDNTDQNIFTFTASHTIPAHGFFLWASTDNNYNVTISADVSSSQNIANNNSVGLRNGPLDTGILVDSVGWGSPTGSPLNEGTIFSTNPGDSQGLERKAYSTSTQATMEGGVDSTKGNGLDTDNNATDFILRSVSQPQNSTSSTETP